MKILQSEITGTQTSFPTNKEEITEWSIKPQWVHQVQTRDSLDENISPIKLPQAPPQDQQRTYVKHWPNIYFVFANLSWAELSSRMGSILEIYKFLPGSPFQLKSMYPRGEGQHQRPFFCFGSQGTWTTALGQSNALDDGLPPYIKHLGWQIMSFSWPHSMT